MNPYVDDNPKDTLHTVCCVIAFVQESLCLTESETEGLSKSATTGLYFILNGAITALTQTQEAV